MESTKPVQVIESTNFENFDILNASLGRKWRLSQIDAGTLRGSYSQHSWGSLDTLRLSFSVAVCFRQPCSSGFFALARLLSENPIKINGQAVDQGGFFMLMPSANYCMTTTGPVAINAALIAESVIETELADAWYSIKDNVTDTAVLPPDLGNRFIRFSDWFLNWLSNPDFSDVQTQNSLSRQIIDVVHCMLHKIGEDIAFDDGGYRPGEIGPSRRGILRLIDHLYQHPETAYTTSEMAAIAGMKRRSFYYSFNKFTGCSPYHFFRYVRLQAVRRALLTRTDKISDLAKAYNFHHHGDFTELYKNTYRELPSETRRKTMARCSGFN